MKRIVAFLLAIAAVIIFVGCGNGEQSEQEGEKKASAMSFKAGFTPDKAIDGDITTGWICKKKASETNMQVFNIDLGRQTEFSKITIDDSFAAGYTNKKPAFLQISAVYAKGDTSSIKSGTAPSNVVSGSADGLSWETENVPTEENPEWLWISLEDAVKVSRIELDNDINNAVAESYELYVSGTSHTGKTCLDVSTYSLVKTETENDEKKVIIDFDEEMTIKDVLLKVKSSVSEGIAVTASLDEIFFYGSVPEDYTEEHYPVKFSILGSVGGDTFNEICTENSNYLSVWERELEQPVKYRYIRYVVFEEYKNNAPSLGEITFG